MRLWMCKTHLELLTLWTLEVSRARQNYFDSKWIDDERARVHTRTRTHAHRQMNNDSVNIEWHRFWVMMLNLKSKGSKIIIATNGVHCHYWFLSPSFSPVCFHFESIQCYLNWCSYCQSIRTYKSIFVERFVNWLIHAIKCRGSKWTNTSNVHTRQCTHKRERE